METLFIGKNIIFLPEVDSTNSYATYLLKNVNLTEGTVIHTTYQTQGKGQRGSVWEAEPEQNLTVSIVLKPSFLDIKNQFFLYQVVALACYDTMAEILDTGQIDIKIKWPNDILVNGKKIAGILLENTIQNNQINSCVAGIGINVNQGFFSGTTSATSLKIVTGKEYTIDFVLKLLCGHLEKRYLSLMQAKKADLKADYLERLYGLNQWLKFDVKGEVKTLEVKGLSDNGLLFLEDEAGKEMEVDVKDVKWIY